MRKFAFKFFITGIMAFSLFSGCKKDHPAKSAAVVKSSQKASDQLSAYMSSVSIAANDADPVGMYSCKPVLMDLLSRCSSGLKMSFSNSPEIRGYVFDLPNAIDGFQISIFTGKDLTSGDEFTLIRKIKGVENNNQFSGEFVLMDEDGTEILHNTYVNSSKTEEINNMSTWIEKNGITPCAMPAQPDPLYFGHCTKKQFNDRYQAAKATCSADIMCDIACTLHPCFIVYLVSAMIDCKK